MMLAGKRGHVREHVVAEGRRYNKYLTREQKEWERHGMKKSSIVKKGWAVFRRNVGEDPQSSGLSGRA